MLFTKRAKFRYGKNLIIRCNFQAYRDDIESTASWVKRVFKKEKKNWKKNNGFVLADVFE